MLLLTKDSLDRCSRCRRQKIKCSGDNPCSACFKRQVACKFDEKDLKVVVTKGFGYRPLETRSATNRADDASRRYLTALQQMARQCATKHTPSSEERCTMASPPASKDVQDDSDAPTSRLYSYGESTHAVWVNDHGG